MENVHYHFWYFCLKLGAKQTYNHWNFKCASLLIQVELNIHCSWIGSKVQTVAFDLCISTWTRQRSGTHSDFLYLRFYFRKGGQPGTIKCQPSCWHTARVACMRRTRFVKERAQSQNTSKTNKLPSSFHAAKSGISRNEYSDLSNGSYLQLGVAQLTFKAKAHSI